MLNKLLLQLVKDGVRKATPYPFGTILFFFVEQVSAQEQTLAALSHKVDELLTSPFRQAKLYLEEAQQATDEKSRRKFIKKARNRFMEASAVTINVMPLSTAQANLYAGICYELMGKRADADRWYGRAEKQLAQSFPDEAGFVQKVSKKRRNFDRKLAQFEDKQKAYGRANKKYKQAQQTYEDARLLHESSLRQLSFLKSQDRRKIGQALAELVARAARGRGAGPQLGRRDLNLSRLQRPGGFPLTDRQKRIQKTRRDLLGPSQSPQLPSRRPGNRRRQLPNPAKRTNLDRHRRPDPTRLSARQFGDRSPIDTVTAPEVSRLYELLEIDRNSRSDAPVISSLLSQKRQQQHSLGAMISNRQLAVGSPMRELTILNLLLQDQPDLARLLQPPPAPVPPDKPDKPSRPNQPKVLQELATLTDSEPAATASFLSRLWSRLPGSQLDLDREAVLFALELNQYLAKLALQEAETGGDR